MTEDLSYVIFLPTALDLERRRAHGTVKIVHQGTVSEQIEMDILVPNETLHAIELALRTAAMRSFERIRAPRDVISK